MLKIKVLRLLVHLTIFIAFREQVFSCSIQMTDLPDDKPIYMVKSNNGLQLFKPTGDTTIFADGDELVTACENTETEFQCSGGNWVRTADGSIFKIYTFSCSMTPPSSVERMNQPCGLGNGGELVKIGFRNTYGFAELITSCVDQRAKRSHYSKHLINGKYKSDDPCETHHDNSNNALIGVKYNTKGDQISYFEGVFGKGQRYISLETEGPTSEHYFAVGHYAPYRDFIFDYEQKATMYLVNAAPQYQKFNNRNWRKVENWAMRKALALNDLLEVYTGSFDQLQYPDDSEERVAVTLQGVPVPRYYFKVVKHKDEAIVFVGDNDIWTEGVRDYCVNICPTASFSVPTPTNLAKGRVICCTLADFHSKIQILPNLIAPNFLNC